MSGRVTQAELDGQVRRLAAAFYAAGLPSEHLTLSQGPYRLFYSDDKRITSIPHLPSGYLGMTRGEAHTALGFLIVGIRLASERAMQ